MLRILPFMNTDPQQTRTIGNLDPPRAPYGQLKDYYVSGRPFGTTHELRANDKLSHRAPRFWTKKAPHFWEPEVPCAEKRFGCAEAPLDYKNVVGSRSTCPVAQNWLSRARNEKKKSDHGNREFWDSRDLKISNADPKMGVPALRFTHGYDVSGVAAITRSNDPFWNIRAFDDALIRHDGYLLSSFICAMNQLVMDDITQF
jgi:hypothetical protein